MIERLALWGLKPGRVREDIYLPGSPERCSCREAVEDTNGLVWMLEQLRPGQFDRRERIGRALATLEGAGLPIPAYLPDGNGRFAVEHGEAFYQLSPFVPGDPLPQPEFIENEERGRNLGTFVATLMETGGQVLGFENEPPFILEDYVNELMGVMSTRRPEVVEVLSPVLPSLSPLFEAWTSLPHTFNQGDFHPLNIIWRGNEVNAVIDWEFCGIRPALFDVANCLGNVGIEDPTSLVRGLAKGLLLTLRDRECLDRESLSLLPEMILGMRFAWMSEWLRRKDKEMAELELRYMRLLANSIDTLLPAWKQLLGA